MGFQDQHIRRYVRASMAEELLDAETETRLALAWRDQRDEQEQTLEDALRLHRGAA